MGVMWDFMKAMWVETFPPKATWTIQDVPSLEGKVFVVTGGNSGLGLETIKVLVSRGAKVYMASRSEEKAKQAISEVEKETGKSPVFLKLDLADLDSVKAAAEEFLKAETRLDVLYNSGGVMIPPIGDVTKQGYDLQFGTNVLGHFYLTKLLLPTLIETAKNSSDHHARVITISSGAHHLHGLDFNALKDGPARKKMTPESLYAQSKYGDVVFSKELAKRYGDQGIVSISLNPGNIHTNLQQRMGSFQKQMVSFMMYPARPNGITTHLWAGTAPETAAFNGKFLIPWARVGTPRKDSQDPKTGQELWTWLEEQVANR
ncbi:NAD-P-binding protein [Infundibulicybe gibba]|nr:NAD-P-binding protein [Infundibulicybe gibba]